MTTYTSRNVPLVEGTDPADIAARVNPVAQLQHDRPGTSALTTAARNALTGAELWDGRLVLNTTTDRLNRYDLGANSWVEIADTQDLVTLLVSSGLPTTSPAATGVRGTSNFAAHADHVHPAPIWQTYAPTVSGITIGNGSISARYWQIGKTTGYYFRIVLGSTSSVTGTPVVTLPVPMATVTSYMSAQATATDAGANDYDLVLRPNAVGAVAFWGRGTAGAFANVTATAPFTFGNSDSLEGRGLYESA